MTASQKAARKRAADSRQQRLEQAIAQLPELKQKQAEEAQRAGKGKCGDQIGAKQPRVSNGCGHEGDEDGQRRFSPGMNVQLATDTKAGPLWEWKSATRVPIRRGRENRCDSK